MVVKKLDALTRRGPPSIPGQGPRILVDTHVKDYRHALELGAFLSKYDVFPYVVPQEDDPEASLTLYEQALKKVSVLLIVFGEVAEEWVRARLSTALQLMVMGDHDIKAAFIYLAPPRKQISENAFHRGVFRADLLDNSSAGPLEPVGLAPLLESLDLGRDDR